MCCRTCRRLASIFHKKKCPDIWKSEALPKPVILRSKYVPEKKIITGRVSMVDDIVVDKTDLTVNHDKVHEGDDRRYTSLSLTYGKETRPALKSHTDSKISDSQLYELAIGQAAVDHQQSKKDPAPAIDYENGDFRAVFRGSALNSAAVAFCQNFHP